MACVLIASAIILHMIALGFRARNSRDAKIFSRAFLIPLFTCCGANLIAALGFWLLATATPNPDGEYSLVLSTLSLLAAGVIAGHFAHTHQDAAPDEGGLSILVSAVFALLFYVIFAAVCLYCGLSQRMHDAIFASEIIPAIMFLILLANTLYESWDWREVD